MHHYEYFWLNPTFWVAVSFVIFVVLLGRTIWAKATEALDARAAKIRTALDEAARLRAEAEVVLLDAAGGRRRRCRDGSRTRAAAPAAAAPAPPGR